MKVLFTGKNYDQVLNRRNPANFVTMAEKLGHVSVDSFEDNPDLLICVDYDRHSLNLLRYAKKIGVRSVLICLEPQVVIPQNNQERIKKLFDAIVWVGRPFQPCIKWPQDWRDVETNALRLDRAIMVNADKWSFVHGHLYWLRAAIATSVDIVDTAGQWWSRSLGTRMMHRVYEFLRTLTSLTLPSLDGLKYVFRIPRNYLGTPDDKIELMSKYRVALVIENSQELLTEKLFDAWFAGCVPVYVGPRVDEYGIPPELVIQSDPAIESIKTAIEAAITVDSLQFIESIKNFLGTSAALEWHSNNALRRALEAAVSPNISN